MGNIDTRCRYDAGYICLQTQKPVYYPGELVAGTIYLRVMQPIEARTIDLHVKGKEKVAWKDE